MITDRGANMGQPEAMFISFLGLREEEEVSSGLKDGLCSWLRLCPGMSESQCV